ncbi:MAG: hypothetical protein JRC99_00070 [Deltaproteobacteria bacterium]|nr:hypothetical protein [Deltaproteobacteria bacterium]
MFDRTLLASTFIDRLTSLDILERVNDNPDRPPIEAPPAATVWVAGSVPFEPDSNADSRIVGVYVRLYLPDYEYEQDASVDPTAQQITAALNGWVMPCIGCSRVSIQSDFWEGVADGGVTLYMIHAEVTVHGDKFKLKA